MHCWFLLYSQECCPQQLVSESKFLQPHALLELVKTLTFASRGADDHVALGTAFSEQTAVFFLELLIAVAMDNMQVGLGCSDFNPIGMTVSGSRPHM